MNQSERLQAIVLRRTNYAETDRIVQLLTPEGRRSVIAKGVRREKSKLAGGIELFALCDVVIRRGRGELGMLTSARLQKFYGVILTDYDKMQFAYQVLKMVARASEQVDEPEWFSVAQQVFEYLHQPSSDRKLAETWFFLQYTALLGDELNLRTDVIGRSLDPERRYMYDAAEKALRLSNQGDIGRDHIKLLRILTAKSLAISAQIGGIDGIIDDCWLLARQHSSV